MDTIHDGPLVNKRSRCRDWIDGWLAVLGLASTLLIAGPAGAQVVASPHAIDIPRWFSSSLLDFKDEIPEAAREGKRVMVYFGQDGCPYCKALMKANFGPGPISDKTRKHFVAIAINIWGDAEVTWIDGKKTTEKGLARTLKVQFTPTLLFFETDGRLVQRLNGYLPPERFTHVLDYVIQRRDRELSLAEYMSAQIRETEIPVHGPRTYLMRDPGKRLDINMYEHRRESELKKLKVRRLPLNLLDALRFTDTSKMIRAAFGDAAIDSYVRLKAREWSDFCGHLTDWEREHTLDC